jgi:GDP-4-dehydro-6-deoxy-D-mannose reductase
MRVLITGVTGFVGGHLADALLERGGVELFGSSRSPATNRLPESCHDRVALRACDPCDGASVEALLREVRPDQIFHLAGYAHAGRSIQEPDAAWAGNLTATRTLYDAVHRWGGKPRILYVSSGFVYGDVDADNRAFVEDHPLQPITPYAASKAAADIASYQYTRFPDLDIVRARPFNNIGPRQSAEYAVPNFARQIAAIEQGKQPPFLETGNLTASRDLTDVRDIVRAYLLIVERGQSGDVFNVASGEAHSMKDVLDRLLAQARVRVEVRTQAKLMRAAENLHHRGDAGKLRRETGWSPQFSLDQTLADTLEYWRKK